MRLETAFACCVLLARVFVDHSVRLLPLHCTLGDDTNLGTPRCLSGCIIQEQKVENMLGKINMQEK